MFKVSGLGFGVWGLRFISSNYGCRVYTLVLSMFLIYLFSISILFLIYLKDQLVPLMACQHAPLMACQLVLLMACFGSIGFVWGLGVEVYKL